MPGHTRREQAKRKSTTGRSNPKRLVKTTVKKATPLKRTRKVTPRLSKSLGRTRRR